MALPHAGTRRQRDDAAVPCRPSLNAGAPRSTLPSLHGGDDSPTPRVESAPTAALFRSLVPARLKIVRRFAAGEARVVDLVDESGLAQSMVFKHLACLCECGLVDSRPALARPAPLTAAEAEPAATECAGCLIRRVLDRLAPVS
ncbi:ArsR family transcriptional regulator [Streptomyces sp. R-74717]|uniref:ArsR family transcriptional regulator n=1 Tax=Streptomyces TaxID=1883 RepID=UPI0037BAE120